MKDERRDRDGEIFENATTNDNGATPPEIEEAQHHLRPDPDVNSQEADEKNPEFAKELKRTGHEAGH